MDFLNNEIKNNDNEKPNFLNKSILSSKNNNQNQLIENILILDTETTGLDENKDEYVIENVCYKEDSKIPIIEESAKLQIAKRLVENGKKVTIKDEIQLINEVKKEYGNIFNYYLNI